MNEICFANKLKVAVRVNLKFVGNADTLIIHY